MRKAPESPVQVPSGEVSLEGLLCIPPDPRGVVLFAHGSGSSRKSPRNAFVAGVLREAGFATLLIDLLTPAEDADYDRRFNVALLVERLHDCVRWLATHPGTRGLPAGLFGASTGAAAAIQLAAAVPSKVAAVVSRGGRPDLAGRLSLERLKAPTLLIVGGDDTEVLILNQAAFDCLACPKSLVVVPGATHLFEEVGALEQAAKHAAGWFTRHLAHAHAEP